MINADLPQKVDNFLALLATIPESGLIEADKAREVIEASTEALLSATTLNGVYRDSILRLCAEKDKLLQENIRLQRIVASGAHNNVMASA